MDLEKQKISLQDFLKQLSEGIESGVEGRQIKDCIKVELSVATKIDVGGKVKFYILNGGAGYQKEDTTRIIF